jgi:hypothetical protein
MAPSPTTTVVQHHIPLWQIAIAATSENTVRTPISHVQVLIQSADKDIKEGKRKQAPTIREAITAFTDKMDAEKKDTQLKRANASTTENAAIRFWRNSTYFGKGFWKGNTGATITRTLQRGTVFGLNDYLPTIGITNIFVAPLLATVIETIIVTPSDNYFRNQNNSKLSPEDKTFSAALHPKQFKNLYNLGLAGLGRNQIFNTIMFIGTQLFPEFRKEHPLQFSAVASQVAVLGSHGFDAIQTAISLDGDGITKPKEFGTGVKAVINAGKSIYATQGVRGFYSGVIPRMGGVGMGCTISFAIYNFFQGVRPT